MKKFGRTIHVQQRKIIQDIVVINIYELNAGTPKFITKKKKNPYILKYIFMSLTESWETSILLPMDRSSRKNMKQKFLEFPEVINQWTPTDVYRIFHPNSKECTFFSAPHRNYSKVDHIHNAMQV